MDWTRSEAEMRYKMYAKNTNQVLQNQQGILFIALPLLVLGSAVWFTLVYPRLTNSLHLVPQFQNLLKRKEKKSFPECLFHSL